MKEDIGYIKAKIEELSEDIKEIKQTRRYIHDKVEKLDKQNSFLKGVGAVFVVAFGTIAKYLHAMIGE